MLPGHQAPLQLPTPASARFYMECITHANVTTATGTTPSAPTSFRSYAPNMAQLRRQQKVAPQGGLSATVHASALSASARPFPTLRPHVKPLQQVRHSPS